MSSKLLLIEDEDTLRENIAELLILNGYQVSTAKDGQQGLSQAALDPPDLIICDIMMPLLDGYQVLAVIRSTSALVRTPFIFLTAKADNPDFRYGMNLGADDYLTKPVTSRDLILAIESRLKHKQRWMVPVNPAVTYLASLRVHNERGSLLLRVEECLYFFTNNREYFVLHALGSFKINKNLDELMTQLNPLQFFRANRKEIIHRNTIRHYAYWHSGKHCVSLSTDGQNR